MSDDKSASEQSQSDLPKWPFPDLVWESFKETRIREISDEDIGTDGLDELIELMWEEPEVHYYLFWPTTRALNATVIAALDSSRVQMLEAESRWYRWPDREAFLKIHEAKHEWHKTVIETQMFYRAELKLSAAEVRRLDQRVQREAIRIAIEPERPSYRLELINSAILHYRRHQDAYNVLCVLTGLIGFVYGFL